MLVLTFIIGKWGAPSIMQKFTPRLSCVTRTLKIPKRICNCFWHEVVGMSVSRLPDICFAFRLSIVGIPQSGRQAGSDGSVLIRSGA